MDEIGSMDVRPYQLMCVVCRLGSNGDEDYYHAEYLDEILSAVRNNRNLPLTLRCNVNEAYSYQNPGRKWDTPEGQTFNDRRDLHVLRKLGLVPGDTRPAIEMFERVFDRIPECLNICGFTEVTSDIWRGCRLAGSGNYERGCKMDLTNIIPARDKAEQVAFKKDSTAAIYNATVLRIRPHHLMCMTCFNKGCDAEDLKPDEKGNPFEAGDAIRKNPNIPVMLIQGCCMICQPCPNYNPVTNRCGGGHGMNLRDEKKDLDVLRLLGLDYGDTLPAMKLLRRLYDRVQSTRQVCGYGDSIVTGYEWTICGGADGSEDYARGRKVGIGVEGAAPE